MASRVTALRHVAHAQTRLLSYDPESLSDAAAYLCRALAAVESLRIPLQDPVAEVIARAVTSKEPTK